MASPSFFERSFPAGLSVRSHDRTDPRFPQSKTSLLLQSMLKAMMATGVMAAAASFGLAPPAKAEKIPYNNSYFATSWCTGYSLSFPFSQNCKNIYKAPPGPMYWWEAFMVYVDWGFGPNDPVGRIKFDIDYDPNLLEFDPTRTTLLCDLRAPGTPSYCPDTPAGQGTQVLGVIADEFTVDQTGLTITEDATGLPSISFDYNAPFPISVGRRNFLALAFRPVIPLPQGTTVTYSTDVLPNATLLTRAFSCTNSSGAVVDCSSPTPSRSFKINPVPGPLAVAGIPMMWHTSRRLRRRVQGSSRSTLPV